MYHYVRDLKNSRYPEIKGLSVEKFIAQLDYLSAHHTIVSMEQVIRAFRGECHLPDNAVLLTFDDGYLDHYLTVFPMLQARGMVAAFYPPVQSVLEHKVLDVNKVHYILANASVKGLLDEIKHFVSNYQAQYALETYAHYYQRLASPNRFDTAEVIFIKRLLQRALPDTARKALLNYLFDTCVEVKESVLARELYMSVEQLHLMLNAGMHIGGHGNEHVWLSHLSKQVQHTEVDRSMHFLDTLGVDMTQWTFCYPYGDYNQATLDYLTQKKCALALTTQVGIAPILASDALQCPRVDTNDIAHVLQNACL